MKKGLESLQLAVIEDTERGENCFNPEGCDKIAREMQPETNPKLLAMGIKKKCVIKVKCNHLYCDKFKWIIDRAKMYADFTGLTLEQVLEEWENSRDYWYMNYYQDCNQPEIKADPSVKIIKYDDWLMELKSRFGEDPKNWRFDCPMCKNSQSGQDFIDAGVEEWRSYVYFSCLGRFKKDIGCDWTLGGLFKIHTSVVVKGATIMPVMEMTGKEEVPA